MIRALSSGLVVEFFLGSRTSSRFSRDHGLAFGDCISRVIHYGETNDNRNKTKNNIVWMNRTAQRTMIDGTAHNRQEVGERQRGGSRLLTKQHKI